MMHGKERQHSLDTFEEGEEEGIIGEGQDSPGDCDEREYKKRIREEEGNDGL